MPGEEVVFATDLPRRVDQVGVALGQVIGAGTPDEAGETSAAVVLSGAEITVVAAVSKEEASLLSVDGPAVVTVPGGGGEVAGAIGEVCADDADPAGSGGEGGETCAVSIVLGDLGGVDRESLVGNVQVTMVVGTTGEDSLVVPVAAVSADAGGNARVKVIRGDLVKNSAAADQETQMVAIEVGLAAEGLVEVVSSDPVLKEGDLVVVGTAGAGKGAPAASADAAS
jgi:hypothetical protein